MLGHRAEWLELDCLSPNSSSVSYKLFNLSEPQFPHLYNRDDNNYRIHLIG